ncbi:hypothetical protein BDB00DRAFT_879948 [Zychaea mexicana]|uniref:uncharacterized protein n=1 Tax=Zychaea mexicana TaxID=64656 RepID=UPI0022FEE2E0|nr:uncharacterized protein BDB00DRAFT_879948 [Zychaea mexicana]KAI9471420.1 hypothetical protein BDB00DRAFT_879948 [Zychaea mexicana]
MERPISGSQAATIATTTVDKPPLATTTNNAAAASATHAGDSIKNLKQKFSEFKFYLDNVDEQSMKKIRDRLKLLNSSAEPFFSNKCTHVITTKSIPGKLTALGENGRTVDPIISNSLKWGLKVWSLDYMNKLLQSLMTGHSTGHRANRKGINKLLEDEKRFGVGTNHGGSANARDPTKPARPVFVPFENYYISVEDMRGVHRPVAVKQYDVIGSWPYIKGTPSGKSPFIRTPGRHPLLPTQQQQQQLLQQQRQQQQQQQQQQQAPKAASQPINDQHPKEDDKENGRPSSQQLLKTHHPSYPQQSLLLQQQQQQQPPYQPHAFAKPLEPFKAAVIPNNTTTTITPPMTPHDPRLSTLFNNANIHNSTADINNENNNNNNIAQHSSSTLKASGLGPTHSLNLTSRTNTRTVLTSSRIVSTSEATTKAYTDNSQNQDERVARLDRRMVDNRAGRNNNGGNAKQLLKTAAMNQTATKETDARAKEQEREKQRQQEREKAQAQKKLELEMHWCENCNKRYSNLKEHIQEKAHQTFVRDQNNFRRFDEVVAKLRRQHKAQIPPLSTLNLPDFDGKTKALKDVDSSNQLETHFMDIDHEHDPVMQTVGE